MAKEIDAVSQAGIDRSADLARLNQTASRLRWNFVT
jgi:hypothetical protein